MAIQIQIRRDTATSWTTIDPILAEGEIGLETDTGKFKIGNGTDLWSVLPYHAPVKATGAEINTGTDDAKFTTPKAITDSILKNSPRGFLLNGKIVPSVTSNNLTVAIKGLDGNDPSATNPVYCRIGDTVRSITAALSITKNAGTNWFGSGWSGMETKEKDYFVYLGYNATDGVVIGFAGLPYATEYDDFSTNTAEKTYGAISTVTHATAGDDYEVIGRFAATLSATANFYWSVPTFTNKNLIQRPIYETRKLDYVPIVGVDSGAITASSLAFCKYQINTKGFFYWIDFTATTITGSPTEMQFSFPHYPSIVSVVGAVIRGNGRAGRGYISDDLSKILIGYYNNSDVFASGIRVLVSGYIPS